MDAGETVRLNSDRLQEITGTSVAPETTMVIQKLDPSATETTIALSTDEASGSGQATTQDEASLPAVLDELPAGRHGDRDAEALRLSCDGAHAFDLLRVAQPALIRRVQPLLGGEELGKRQS